MQEPALSSPKAPCPELVEGLKVGEADPEASILDLAPFLTVHVPPQTDHTYVIGADPAEGNPQSDESAAVVLDLADGEQVATLGLRCDPEDVRRVFEPAGKGLRQRHAHPPRQLPLRSRNPGRAQQSRPCRAPGAAPLGAYLLPRAGQQTGWATTGASKSMLFDLAAKDIRVGGLRLHDETTFWQLTAIAGATLAAPSGQHDDRAIACVLALAALRSCRPGPRLRAHDPAGGRDIMASRPCAMGPQT